MGGEEGRLGSGVDIVLGRARESQQATCQKLLQVAAARSD